MVCNFKNSFHGNLGQGKVYIYFLSRYFLEVRKNENFSLTHGEVLMINRALVHICRCFITKSSNWSIIDGFSQVY